LQARGSATLRGVGGDPAVGRNRGRAGRAGRSRRFKEERELADGQVGGRQG
jgi:hypothetical protein